MARVVFLQRHYYEYGGPSIISSVLKKNGHEVSLFIGEDNRDFLPRIRRGDIVAFSIMTGLHHWAVKIASEIKSNLKVLTVFGGPHPTYFPEIIESPSVDIVCVGEGEFPMLDIADSIDKGKDITHIPNLWVKEDKTIYKNDLRPLISDLDALPFPDRNIYYTRYFFLRKNPHKTFMAGRGCPYKCAFCFNPRLQEMYRGKGAYIRFRSPQNVVEEIRSVRDGYGIKTVFFADDIFILNKKWLREFLPLYRKEVNLPFTCDGRADILDEEIAALLQEAGCFCIRFGIESGNERIRNQILKKNIANEQIVNATQILKRNKIRFMTYNMVGNPGEKIEDAYETVELNIKIGTSYPRCSILTPYPGTEIAEYASREDLLDESTSSILASSQQSESIVRSMYKRQFLNIHLFFQTAIIFPWSWRIIKKLLKLPPNIFFRFWWAFVYFFVFVKAEGRSFLYTFIFAVKTVRSVFEKD